MADVHIKFVLILLLVFDMIGTGYIPHREWWCTVCRQNEAVYTSVCNELFVAGTTSLLTLAYVMHCKLHSITNKIKYILFFFVASVLRH